MTTVNGKRLARTTGIGSLPHHNIDAALEYSFRHSLPYLPQIPIRNHWEYMIAQTLEGMPGLQAEQDGSATLDLDIWLSRAKAFNARLSDVFEADSYELFEPGAAVSSGWQPFLWELQERGARAAKIQLCGPLTAQWALRIGGAPDAATRSDIASQIYRLVLARGLAMSQRLQAMGVAPTLYLDEPGLYVLSKSNPRHMPALGELKLAIQTLRKKGVTVGLHCCSNTDWDAILGIGLDVLSIDAALSLDRVLASRPAVERFVAGGGRFSLGVIPTSLNSPSMKSSYAIHALDTREIFRQVLASFEAVFKDRPELVRQILADALYTPACGLALHSVSDAEAILAALTDYQGLCSSLWQ